MSKEPNRNIYVGHRYVPKIMGEWDNSIDYEGLSIVTYQGASYTSKKRVPVGIDILNNEFWVVTGNYNAQIEEYRQDVRSMGDYVDGEVTELNKELDTHKGFVNNELTEMNQYIDEKLSNIAYLLTNGVDDTENIRSVLSEGKKLRLLKTDTPFKIDRAIVRKGDNFNVDIEGQGGIVEIELLNKPSETNSDINSIFRPDENLCKGFRLRNLKLTGNWNKSETGVDYDTGFSTGIGVWLTPSDNYIPDIHNVTAEYFLDYGHYFYVKNAVAGDIYAHHNRVQGVAIVNVSESLKIDYIGANDNGQKDNYIMGAGVDIEYSAGRGVPLKNISIGKINANNNIRGTVINSGMATDSEMNSFNMSSHDFNVKIDEINTENNLLNGTLIDFPHVDIGVIRSENDFKDKNPHALGAVQIRNTKDIKKGTLNIDSIKVMDGHSGFYMSGNSGFPGYEAINIGSLTSINNDEFNIYGDSIVSSFININSVTDKTNKVSTRNSLLPGQTNISKGQLLNADIQRRDVKSSLYKVPSGLSEIKNITVGFNRIITRVVVNVNTPETARKILRLRLGTTIVSEIDVSVKGEREFTIMNSIVKDTDRSINPMGMGIDRVPRIEPVDNPINADIDIYIEYSTL